MHRIGCPVAVQLQFCSTTQGLHGMPCIQLATLYQADTAGAYTVAESLSQAKLYARQDRQHIGGLVMQGFGLHCNSSGRQALTCPQGSWYLLHPKSKTHVHCKTWFQVTAALGPDPDKMVHGLVTGTAPNTLTLCAASNAHLWLQKACLPSSDRHQPPCVKRVCPVQQKGGGGKSEKRKKKMFITMYITSALSAKPGFVISTALALALEPCGMA